MKITKLFILFIFVTSASFAQDLLPIKYRVEKQSMSIPMSDLEETYFESGYYSKPITVDFDGVVLNMFYDNQSTFIKKAVTEVQSNADFDEDEEFIKRHYYTMNDNVQDTIMFVVDYEISYVQLVLPTKNSKGEKVGYTSYKKYLGKEELAIN